MQRLNLRNGNGANGVVPPLSRRGGASRVSLMNQDPPDTPLTRKDVAAMVGRLGVLLVEDNVFMRKMVRNLLMTVGVREVYEAADGIAGLDALRTAGPDIVILDWEMPLLNGAEFLRIVRSPDVFPMPDVPVIMLSAHCERWRIVEAGKLGVHEYLRKPVSAQSLLDRMVSILAKPRPMVRVGDYYGPAPRTDLGDAVWSDGLAPALNGAMLS